MQNILLVEDNKADVILSKLTIERWGFPLDRLDVAESLEQARTLMSVKDYGAVFIDYKLPDGNGIDLVKDIDLEKTTVTILSGHPDFERIRQDHEGDLSDVKFIEKPLRQEALEAFVDEVRIEKKVQKKVRARCIAFWSVASTSAALIGGFFVENSMAAKAAFKAFIEVWLAK